MDYIAKPFNKGKKNYSNCTKYLTLWLVELTKPFKSLIGNINSSLIGLNGTEWKVFSRYR